MITIEEAIMRLRAAGSTARSELVARHTDYNKGYRDGLATALTVVQSTAPAEQDTSDPVWRSGVLPCAGWYYLRGNESVFWLHARDTTLGGYQVLRSAGPEDNTTTAVANPVFRPALEQLTEEQAHHEIRTTGGFTGEAESVDHPAHYGGDGNAYEAIKVIEAMGDGPAFCRGNAIKYLMRHDKKGAQLDDLKKARWYVDRMIEQLEGGET